MGPAERLDDVRLIESDTAKDLGQMETKEPPSSTSATPEEVAALRDLLDFGRTDVASRLRADGEPDARALIIALFSRATTTLQALVLLVENDFGQQAMMLNRAAFELLVDAYWTEENRELAADRFVRHARFHQHLKRESAQRYPELLDPGTAAEPLDTTELAELTDLYRPHGVRSWTALSIHQRVESIVDSFGDPHDRKQLRGFRDIVYRLNNEELHPTPWSISRVLRRRPTADGGEALLFRIAPEPELGQLALRSAWWMYLQLVSLILDSFEITLGGALEKLIEKAPWADER